MKNLCCSLHASMWWPRSSTTDLVAAPSDSSKEAMGIRNCRSLAEKSALLMNKSLKSTFFTTFPLFIALSAPSKHKIISFTADYQKNDSVSTMLHLFEDPILLAGKGMENSL